MYSKIKHILWKSQGFVFSLLLLFSCKPNSVNHELENKLRSLTITIPTDSMELLLPKNKDSTYADFFNTASFQYIIYYDSTVCSVCNLRKMGIWYNIIRKSKKIDSNIKYIFIFQPKHEMIQQFKIEYYAQKVSLPFYIDSTGIMERLNPILSQSQLYCSFVLNKNNHIEVIGDASKNLIVEERFYDFLKKKKEN